MRKNIKKLINKGSVVAISIAVAAAMMNGVPGTNFDGFVVTADAKMIVVTPQLTGIEGTPGSNAKEGYGKIFDGEYVLGNSTKWCVTDFEDAYVIFSSENSVIVDGYTFVTGSDNAQCNGRNPASWTLYGCNDENADRYSESWVEIHSVTNDDTLRDANCEAFSFEVTGQETAYKYFKLEITNVAAGDVMQLGEFMLSGRACAHEDTVKGNTVLQTCIQDGYTNYTCNDCGEDYKGDIVPSKGHSYEDGVCTECTGIKVGNFVIYSVGDEDINSGDDYSYGYGVLTIKSDKPVRIENENFKKETSDGIEVADGVSANITLGGVNISVKNGAAFKIADNSRGNVTIILADGAENILHSSENCAGLQKNGEFISETEGKLTIKGESDGTGKLMTSGGRYGAGIGGGYYRTSSNITISGGVITAIGGGNGAGIGGGSSGECSNVTISGGVITAIGGEKGAGIGGGFCRLGSNITISGGKITATGGENGAGIGGGFCGTGSNITISGGEITATGGENGAGIGGGYESTGGDITIIGGSVKMDGVINCTPTLEDGVTKVHLLELPVNGTDEVVINGNTNYPKKHGNENKLYVYLPASTQENLTVVTNGDSAKKYFYDTSKKQWIRVADLLSEDNSVFTYNGEEQIYNIPESDAYIVSGDRQTNAGTYTVTVELAENAVWSDGTTDNKTFEFTIAQAVHNITADDVTFTYTENGQINATSDGGGTLTYKVVTGDDVISVDADGKITALKPGTATVMIKASETENYAEGVKTITVTANKKIIEIPKADDSKFIYNGKEHIYTITESEFYTVTGNKQTYVGAYTVTVTLAENTEWSDGTTEAKTYEFVVEGYGLCVSKDGKWYYYNKTDIDTEYVGMADNKYGTWYVSNGSIDYIYKGMFYNDGNWVYINNGRIDTTYTGMAENKYGVWYMKDGKIDRTCTGMYLYNGQWIYVKSGKYDTSYTGMAKNSAGWWYIKNGVLDRTYTGMAENEYGVWYMNGGKLDRTYTGMCLYDGNWIYVKEGKYNTAYTGMAENKYGVWYMKEGKLDRTYTGMYLYNGQWIYVKSGKYETSYTGLAKNSAGWWYIKNGNLDRTYTGLAENSYGRWYVKNGKLDLSFSGKVTVGGTTYTIKNGKLV